MARPLHQPREDREVFVVPLEVRPEHIDANGHVNNVVYVGWLQDAGTAHWNARFSEADRTRWSWVALRHEIDYRGNLAEGGFATGETWVPDPPRGARFNRHFRFADGAGRVLVEGITTWALLDRASGRLVRVRPEIAAPFLAP